MGFCRLDSLITDIVVKHNNIAERWRASEEFLDVNLSTKKVIDILDCDRHPEYLGYIFKHRAFLFDEVASYCLELGNSGHESRVKNQNSIESKLSTYMHKDGKGRESLGGEVAIKKCLNDLFGIRYVFDNNEYKLSEIFKHVKTTFPKLKSVDASKNEYKGIHMYFQKDNFSFPWELQIWNGEDVFGNRQSHSKYKQEYTKWESESEKETERQ